MFIHVLIDSEHFPIFVTKLVLVGLRYGIQGTFSPSLQFVDGASLPGFGPS